MQIFYAYKIFRALVQLSTIDCCRNVTSSIFNILVQYLKYLLFICSNLIGSIFAPNKNLKKSYVCSFGALESTSTYANTAILNILSTKCASLFPEKLCLKLFFFLKSAKIWRSYDHLSIFWDKDPCFDKNTTAARIAFLVDF